MKVWAGSEAKLSFNRSPIQGVSCLYSVPAQAQQHPHLSLTRIKHGFLEDRLHAAHFVCCMLRMMQAQSGYLDLVLQRR